VNRPPKVNEPLQDADRIAWVEAECEKIASSKKYRNLSETTIFDVLCQEAISGRSPNHSLAAARKRLHRIAAGYLGRPKHKSALQNLDAAFADGSEAAIRNACETILGQHASTRERLPHLQEIFNRLVEMTGVPNRLLDVACAIQPLAWRWSGLSGQTEYHAYDINSEFVELARRYFELDGSPHQVEQRDILVNPPTETGDVAILWKMYHCLEQRRPGAGLEVVKSVPVRFVSVSFPTTSLAGKRMAFHEKHEPTLREQSDWKIQSYEVPGELFLIVDKGGAMAQTETPPQTVLRRR